VVLLKVNQLRATLLNHPTIPPFISSYLLVWLISTTLEVFLVLILCPLHPICRLLLYLAHFINVLLLITQLILKDHWPDEAQKPLQLDLMNDFLFLLLLPNLS